MNALKDLGLDVTKGAVNTEGSVKQSKFCITRLNQLAMGEAFAVKAPEKKVVYLEIFSAQQNSCYNLL
ncbi:hypothetical protein CUMW_228720 [Citrus unshiu]|nr:hypothetical protein CUMW_228720 [Citrus unshiu]